MDRAAKKVGFGLLVEVTWVLQVFFILKINFWICLQEKAHAWRDLSEKRALSARRLFFVDGGSIN
jgi:hypothetical protein